MISCPIPLSLTHGIFPFALIVSLGLVSSPNAAPPSSRTESTTTRTSTTNSSTNSVSDDDLESTTTSKSNRELRKKNQSNGLGYSYTYSTSKSGSNMKRGSGTLTSEKRNIAPFTGIVLDGGINLEVTIGSTTSAEVEIDDNLQDHIILEVVDGDLLISSKGSYSTRTESLVKVTTPSLEYLRTDGSGNTDILGLSGKEFTYELYGSGNLYVDGAIDLLEVQLNGSGLVDTRECKAMESYVNLNGSGNIRVTAISLIDARLSGSGDIHIYGKPGRVIKNEAGSGEIVVH